LADWVNNAYLRELADIGWAEAVGDLLGPDGVLNLGETMDRLARLADRLEREGTGVHSQEVAAVNAALTVLMAVNAAGMVFRQQRGGAPEDDSLGTSIDRAAQDPTVGEAPARRISCLSQ